MRKYNENTEVTFYAGMGYIQGNRKETQTLLELGLNNGEIEWLSDKEIEEIIDESFDFWLGNCMDVGWHVKDEEA